MRMTEVSPPILAANAPADPAVVTCALALNFGHGFDSDRDAKVQFGVAATTDVRSQWLSGKVGQLLAAAPRALDAIASVFSAGPDPADLRRSLRLAEPPAAAASPAPAASSSDEAAGGELCMLEGMKSQLEPCSALPESQESEHASELAAEDDVAAVLVGMHGPPAV